MRPIPIAMLMEQAGGAASTGRERILDRVPRMLHERVPLIFGSREEVARLERHHIEPHPPASIAAVRPARPVPGLSRAAAGSRHVVSIKHPIISITGSSGSGTTSVKKTFDEIFRRENIKAAFIEGDAFHRYDRAGMRTAMAEAQKTGNNHFSHFGPEANLIEELEAVFREYSESGTGRTRHYIHDADEAESYGRAPGTFTDWQPLEQGTDLLFYEGLHGAVVTDKRQHRALCRPQDRRGAGDQSRMDPEDPSRQDRPRLYPGSGGRHHPAPHAGLRELYLPAVHRDRHQFPARADGRHLQPVHRALDPDARRIDGGDPLPQSARHRFRLPASR